MLQKYVEEAVADHQRLAMDYHMLHVATKTSPTGVNFFRGTITDNEMKRVSYAELLENAYGGPSVVSSRAKTVNSKGTPNAKKLPPSKRG